MCYFWLCRSFVDNPIIIYGFVPSPGVKTDNVIIGIRPTHVPNLTDELSTAKARRLSQFGTAVLVWCDKSVKYDRVCPTFFELNLGSTNGAPSESDVAPVSLRSRTYSVRFGTCKVWRLNQASNDLPLKSKEVCIITRSPPASLPFKAQAT